MSRGVPRAPRTTLGGAGLALLTVLAWIAVSPSPATAGVSGPAATAALRPVDPARAPLPAAPAADPAAPGPVPPGPVILLGTGGLTWDDIGPRTPALSALARTAGLGSLAVRNVRPATCPVDGWLAVSAGRRTGDEPSPRGEDDTPACRPPAAAFGDAGGPAGVPRWEVYAREARAGDFEARPGLLGATLAAGGRTSAAVGPGAVLALAVPPGTTAPAPDGAAPAPDGGTDTSPGTTSPGTTSPGTASPGTASPGTARVARAWEGLGNDPLRADHRSAPEDLATDVRDALADTPDLLVVDLGALRDPAGPGSGLPPRTAQLAALDARVAAVLRALPVEATVLVASLADSGATPHLQALLATGPAPRGRRYDATLLGATSTRQDGMAQATDVMPTLLAALGLERPDEAAGAVIGPVGEGNDAASRLRRVLDLDRAAQAVRPAVWWFFNGLIVGQLLVYVLATVVLRRRAGAARRRRVMTALRWGTVAFASVPAATFLANLLPWWRSSHPGWAVTGAVALFALPLAVLALAGPWRHQFLGSFGVIGGATAGVLAVDALTGSRLVLSSLMGVQPVVAGRFYGFSNPGFALFATGALLLAIALADALVRAGRRRTAVLCTALVGAVATVVDGMPGWGSDFGGPPAIVPAFAVLGLLVAGVRVTVRRAATIAAGTVAVLLGLSVLDWARPPGERTHLGQFVQTALDGGAWPVIRRKAEQNLRILLKPIALPLPAAVAFVVFVLARPVSCGARPLQLAYDRSPVLRQGLVALAVLLTLGFALNDSGAAIPAVAATVALPLLIAASVRALSDAERASEAHGGCADGAGAGPGSRPPATPDVPRPAR